MKSTALYITLFSFVGLSLLVSCDNKYLDATNKEFFSKLYRGTADIEAVDFMIKPDKSGYLILGNTNFIEDETANSNLILFDVSNNGYLKKTIELSTTSRDLACKIYYQEGGDNVYIIGKRRKSENQEITILVKTNLNAEFTNYNVDSINYQDIRELKYNPNDDLRSYVMNDMAVINGEVILAGYVAQQTGLRSAVSRSYNLNSLFIDFETPVEFNNQLPIDAKIKYDNSEFKKIGENDYAGYPITLYGHKLNSAGFYDISNFLISDVGNFSYISPSISDKENATSSNQFLSSYYINEIDNSIIYVGENKINNADSIYIMRAIFNPSLSGDSIGYNIVSLDYFTNVGTNAVDLTQTAKGEFLLATISNEILDTEIVSADGIILGFSFLVNNPPQEIIRIDVAGNGFQNIKRIKYDAQSDATYIMSGVTLGTDETAIELSKVRF